jgi:L-amino acid N-acyltransferase YncA
MASRVYSPRRDLVVRAAERDDIPAVTAIYNRAVEQTTATYDWEPVSLESRLGWFEAKLAGRWPVLVATDAGGTVVGWATYGPFRPEKVGWDPTVEHSVYVAEGSRGGGVGSALLSRLIELARAAGYHTMVGVVDAANGASVAFHVRHGFTEVGLLREAGLKFGRRLDVAIVQRLL